jgi:hypothetical protein
MCFECTNIVSDNNDSDDEGEEETVIVPMDFLSTLLDGPSPEGAVPAPIIIEDEKGRQVKSGLAMLPQRRHSSWPKLASSQDALPPVPSPFAHLSFIERPPTAPAKERQLKDVCRMFCPAQGCISQSVGVSNAWPHCSAGLVS